jgi:hypothetical protein
MFIFEKKQSMKYVMISLCCLMFACSPGPQKQDEHNRDSIERSELEKVKQMKTNEDSLVREEEKRLMEKYGR